MGNEQLNEFKQEQAALVAKANAPVGVDVQQILKKSRYSLTNVRNIIQVMNRKTA